MHTLPRYSPGEWGSIMRSHPGKIVALCIVSMVAARCGGSSTAAPADAGSGSGGSGSDAGSSGADAGSGGGGGGSADAGGGSGGGGGGSADAGSGSGGSGGDGGGSDGGSGGDGGGGGSDGGSGGVACTQPGPGSVISHDYVIDPASRVPGYTTGDGSGTMLFVVTPPGPGRDTEGPLVSSNGTLKKYMSFTKPAQLHADAAGFSGTIAGFSGSFTLAHYDAEGSLTGALNYQMPASATAPVLPFADPRDGTLLLGSFRHSSDDPSAASRRATFVRGAIPTELWTSPLAGTGAVFGAGMDLSSNALAILDGSPRFGAGAISAQWFSATGSALTDEFLLIQNFQAGMHTWFEVSALVGGGVAVRRVDSPDSDGTVQSSQYLCVVELGKTTCGQPPDWLASRRDARIEPIRNGTAYAVVPDPQSASSCSQRVEVVDSNGASCGTMDLPMAAGSCTTRSLSVGKDGTLIQPLADPAWKCGPDPRPCRPTYRWFPGMLK